LKNQHKTGDDNKRAKIAEYLFYGVNK